MKNVTLNQEEKKGFWDKPITLNFVVMALSVFSVVVLLITVSIAYFTRSISVWIGGILLIAVPMLLFGFWKVILKIIALQETELQVGERIESSNLIDLWTEKNDEGIYYDMFARTRKGEISNMVVGPHGLLVGLLNGASFGKGRYYCSTYAIFSDAETYEAQHVITITKKPTRGILCKLFPKMQIVHWEIHITPQKLEQLMKSGLKKTNKSVWDYIAKQDDATAMS